VFLFGTKMEGKFLVSLLVLGLISTAMGKFRLKMRRTIYS